MKEIYEQYYLIKTQIKSLVEQEDHLKKIILKDLEDKQDRKADTQYGKFITAYRPVWIYSKAVKTLEEKYKEAQIREQETGVAKKKETPYLLFKPTK